MNIEVSPIEWTSRRWWWTKRCQYNEGLILAGFIAFILYCLLGPIFIAPHEEFEETVFEMAFQGGCYLFLMGIANILYILGWVTDIVFNKSDSQRFRETLFAIGYWFSFVLPILLILSIMARFYFLKK